MLARDPNDTEGTALAGLKPTQSSPTCRRRTTWRPTTTRPVPDNVDTHKVDTEGLRLRETETDSESTRPDETNQMPGMDGYNRMSRKKNIHLHLGMPSVFCNYPDPFYFRQFFPFFFHKNFQLSFFSKSKSKHLKSKSN